MKQECHSYLYFGKLLKGLMHSLGQVAIMKSIVSLRVVCGYFNYKSSQVPIPFSFALR